MAKTTWQYNDVVKETDLNQIGQEINAAAASAASAQQYLTTHKTTAVLDHPDGSVTTAKLAAKAVTQAKIGDKAVGLGQLGDKAVGSGQLADGAATDTVIGARTVADTAAPTGDSGTITALLGWMANMVKSITGKSNWRTAPATSLEEAKAHMDATTGVHGATSSANSNALMQRDASGRVQVAAPSAAADAARKDTVDGAMSSHVGAADPHSQYVQKTGGTVTGDLTLQTQLRMDSVANTASQWSRAVYFHTTDASAAKTNNNALLVNSSNDLIYNKAGGANNTVLTSGNHDGTGDPHTQYAPKANPTFTGTVTASTAAAGTNTTQVATTAFVKTAIDNMKVSPTFTGTVTLPNTTASSLTVSSSASAGIELGYTGGTATTPYLDFHSGAVAADYDSRITAGGGNGVNGGGNLTIQSANLYVTGNMVSPALTGAPTAPTAAAGTNSTQIATTAFVANNAQLQKITQNDGSPTVYVTATDDLLAMIKNRGAGLHTIRCLTGATNSPASSLVLNGVAYLVSTAGGMVLLSDNNGNVYTATLNNTWSAWTKLAGTASPTFTGTVTLPSVQLTGNIESSDAGDHRFIKKNAAVEQGYYVNDTTVGVYDWKNSRNVMSYNPTINDMWLGTNVSSITLNSSTVAAPTPTTGDNSTKVATTAFVQTAISTSLFGTTTSSGSTYSVTLTPALTALPDGLCVSVKLNANNTGAVSLNVNGLGAKPIKKANGSDPAASLLKSGSIYTLRYNATTGNFILQGEGGEYGTATAAQVLSGYTIGTDAGLVAGTLAAGKKFASGQSTLLMGSPSTPASLTVTGLDFTPRLVIGKVQGYNGIFVYVASGWQSMEAIALATNLGGYSPNYAAAHTASYGTFTLKVDTNNVNAYVSWVAIGD